MQLEQRNGQVRLDLLAGSHTDMKVITDPNDFHVTILFTDMLSPVIQKLAINMTQHQYQEFKKAIEKA